MIWKSAVHPNVFLPDLKVCGWKEKRELRWMDAPFPKDIEEIMFDLRYRDQYDYGSKNEGNDKLNEFDAYR